MKTMTTKTWYQMTNSIEYSTNYNFFRENQIRIVTSNNQYNFCSKLENKSFLGNCELNDIDIEEIVKEIHTNLLNGEYGTGKIIN